MVLGRKRILSDRMFAVILLIPAFLVLGGVILLPLVDAMRMSFTKTSLTSLRKHTYIGFKNYHRIFTDPTYWEVVKNTFFIVGVSVALSLITGTALALALNAIKNRGKAILRALFIIPWLVPGVVIGITWSWMLGTETGVINYLLKVFGMIKQNLPWLADKTLSVMAVDLVFVWSSVPFIMVTILGGLQTIPDEFVEAAIVDGATFFQRLRFVVLPLLTPIIAIATILRIIYTMQNFVIIYMLTQGGPGYATETFALYVYETAFNSARLGRAAAIGTTWLFFLLIFVVMYLKLVVGKEEKVY
jgi:multiple sugar transport system permease protein